MIRKPKPTKPKFRRGFRTPFMPPAWPAFDTSPYVPEKMVIPGPGLSAFKYVPHYLGVSQCRPEVQTALEHLGKLHDGLMRARRETQLHIVALGRAERALDEYVNTNRRSTKPK